MLIYNELYTLLNRIAQWNPEWHSNLRNATKKVVGILKVDQFTAISTQIFVLQIKIINMMLGTTQLVATVDAIH